MADCDVQALISGGRCFAAMPPGLLNSILVTLWCNAINAIVVPSGNPAVQNIDDGLWYELIVDIPFPGKALLWISQTPTTPGSHPYLVITDTDDSLRYKLRASGASPVTWDVDPTPTVEAATPTIIVDGSNSYTLSLVNPGPVPLLTLI